jgi:glycine cleavage system H protein
MFMPVGGEVLEINPALEESPDLVNKDPYGKGWMIKVKVSDPGELKKLMSAKEYSGLIG